MTEQVSSLIASYLEENSIDLVEITYKREQGSMILRLLVDTAQGITINECEKLNNYLSEFLDKNDIVDEHYLLEVASPGLDRPITTDKDFKRVMGKELYISTYERIDAKKEHEGRLIGMDKESVIIESGGVATVIPKIKIARAKRRIEI
ncbi:MAG: ribosome maturation factor RimP [Candidatus Omnitrophota bacterium]